MLICRKDGCDLTYCQNSMSDPYERPFENCDQQFKALNNCIARERRLYMLDDQKRSLKDHVYYRLKQREEEAPYVIPAVIDQTAAVRQEKEREMELKQ